MNRFLDEIKRELDELSQLIREFLPEKMAKQNTYSLYKEN